MQWSQRIWKNKSLNNPRITKESQSGSLQLYETIVQMV